MMKMQIGFIGAGKVGKALGLYFKNHNLNISGYCSKSLESAQEAAKTTDTNCFDSIEALMGSSDLLFITTPDSALYDVDKKASDLQNNHKKIWVHASGAYPSDCLLSLKMVGCPVGCMHPLQSFGDPFVSAKMLEETFFSIEGTQEAMDAIKFILQKTGGYYNEISAGHKPLYHAGACVISNYLVTLLDCGMRFMETAGMDRKTLFQAIRPLIDGTLKNIQEKGTVDALTGPIVRSDYDTVSMHLKAIEANIPKESDIYRTLALKTLDMIEERRIGHEQADRFRDLLKGNSSNEQ
ncbi:MAG: DUF2520 domain-containing protein [Clostridia bacterium]|nr:DUF2520 domain-containing protein [Clostridia bacterium]